MDEEQNKEQQVEVVDSVEEKKDDQQLNTGNIPNIDSRMNPTFLKVADYFGIDEKTFRISESKLNEIIEWAESETKSKNPVDILSKISETSRGLQSPGFGEHKWAILHRYIRLASEMKPINDEIKKLEEKKGEIRKEMNVYVA